MRKKDKVIYLETSLNITLWSVTHQSWADVILYGSSSKVRTKYCNKLLLADLYSKWFIYLLESFLPNHYHLDINRYLWKFTTAVDRCSTKPACPFDITGPTRLSAPEFIFISLKCLHLTALLNSRTLKARNHAPAVLVTVLLLSRISSCFSLRLAIGRSNWQSVLPDIRY
ncbi:hypothetical protein VTK26DRAFT_1237 [Humicola hyalothermophila]